MFIRGRNEFSANSYTNGFSRRSRRNGDDSFANVFVYFVAAAVIIAIGCIIPQLIPETVAYNAAEGIGFTNVKVVDRQWLFIQLTGCDGNDSVKFTVVGTNPAGRNQTFIVCAGLFKGGTPRFR